MTTINRSWLDGLFGNPIDDGTRAGSFLTWDGTNWIESYSLAIPGGSARSIGIAAITSGSAVALTIQGQNTSVAGAAGGAIILDAGSGGAGGNAGIVIIRRGGVDHIYVGTSQTRIHAPPGGTISMTDGAGDQLVSVGAAGQLGFFGSAGTTLPSISSSTGTLADLLTALSNLGIIFLNP